MGHEELAAGLNEVPNKSISGLLLGMALKYGLPSVCCVWLFFVISQKDAQIFSLAQNTAAALVSSTKAQEESNHQREIGNATLQKLADAVDRLAASGK